MFNQRSSHDLFCFPRKQKLNHILHIIKAGIMLRTTVGLCEGLEFEIRLTSGNDNLEREYKISGKLLRTSQAPDQS